MAETPAARAAGSSFLFSLSQASKRLNSAMIKASAGVAGRIATVMIASHSINSYLLTGSCRRSFPMDLSQYIRDVPDFPKPGILFYDITPLIAEPKAFQHSIERLCSHYADRRVDAIAAAEARGFLFAAPMALLMKRPLI